MLTDRFFVISGLPMLGRSRVRSQTEIDTLVPSVGGWRLSVGLTTLAVKRQKTLQRPTPETKAVVAAGNNAIQAVGPMTVLANPSREPASRGLSFCRRRRRSALAA